MKLSAIIPTHNRAGPLRRCLEALREQEVDPAELEVVVVDDGSDEDVSSIVLEVAAGGPVPMQYERQAPSGLNAARNRGAASARGAVIAFLDDDAVVCPGWAQAVLRGFQDPQCAGMGGRVELELAGPAPVWIEGRTQYLAEYDLGSDSRWLRPDDPVPVGANCAVRRSEFDQLGGFRGGLDRIGRSLVSNGDTDFFRRLRANGGAIRYDPGARVLHCVPAERLTLRFFIRRQHAQGVSDELLLADESHPVRRLHRLGLARMLARTAKMLCLDVIQGRGGASGLIEMSYWTGRLDGTRRPRL